MRRGLLPLLTLLAAALLFALLRPRPPDPFDPTTAHYRLAEEAQKRLWEVEQAAFLLGRSATSVLSRALKEGNYEPWRGLLAPGARISYPAGLPPQEGGGFVREVSAGPDAPGTADGLFALLDEARALFRRLDRASVHFERLTPDGEGWRGSFTLQMTGESLAGGPGEWFADLEARYGPFPPRDLMETGGFVTSLRVVALSLRTATATPFIDATAECGIDPLQLADRWGWRTEAEIDPATCLATICFDYDGDGRLDLLLFHGRPLLYRGEGEGRFRECAEAAGLPVQMKALWMGGVAADFDGDGDEDLIVDIRRGKQGSNLALENRGNGTFRPRTPEEFPFPGCSVTNGAIADYDGDGLLDLYLANSGEAPPPGEKRERWIGDRSTPHGLLLRNRGGWRFEDVTARAGVAAGYRDIFAANWFDCDDDGDADLLLANHMGENPLFRNEGDGTFREFAPPPASAASRWGSSPAIWTATGAATPTSPTCPASRARASSATSPRPTTPPASSI
ncbi:MAG: VCBS repeat-containing protein [Planctomycetes bacterium]|nr:VCBS repeat-containing protein [Planctomycetota bacterium]